MVKLHTHLSHLVIPIHVLWIATMFFIEFNPVYIFLILGLWVIFGGIGLEIGYHRTLSHKQFQVSLATEKFMTLLGCFSMNGSPTFWRAMHVGYHHPYSDTHRDFHTSSRKGKFYSYIGYINSLDKLKYIGCKSMLCDNYYKFVNAHYKKILWLTIGAIALISIEAMFILVSAMIICFHQTALINTICHCTNMGYRNFETRDQSRNIYWFSFFTFGQALHNNHHARPESGNYAYTDKEIDLGFILSKILGLKLRNKS